jgi:hypothetical protein
MTACLPRSRCFPSSIACSKLTAQEFRARRESVCLQMEHFSDFASITLAEIFAMEIGEMMIPLYAERLLDAYVECLR